MGRIKAIWERSRLTTVATAALVLVPTGFLVQRQWRSLTQWHEATDLAQNLTTDRLLLTLDERLRQAIVKAADAYLTAPSSALHDESKLKEFVRSRTKRLKDDERNTIAYVMAQSFAQGQSDACARWHIFFFFW